MPQVLYHGAAAQAVPYFEGRGYAYSPGTNPADWLLFLSTTTTAMGVCAGGWGPAPFPAAAVLLCRRMPMTLGSTHVRAFPDCFCEQIPRRRGTPPSPQPPSRVCIQPPTLAQLWDAQRPTLSPSGSASTVSAGNSHQVKFHERQKIKQS